MAITDAQAKNLREKSVAIAIREYNNGGFRDTKHGKKGEKEEDHVYDRAYIGGTDNHSIYIEKNKHKDSKGEAWVYDAWCKQFITKIVMPKVVEELPYGQGAEVAWGSAATQAGVKTFDFPVKGMIFRRDPGGDGSKTGHVGVVISVNYKTGEIWTIEGNASESVAKRSYKAGYLRTHGVNFYRMWEESETSLINSAGGQGNVDSFRNAYKTSTDGSTSNETPGGKKNFGKKATVSADGDGTSSTSSSEKQPFEIPYMTVAEATDYLKNLSNPNQGEGNGTTTGNVPLTANPVG